MEYSMKTREEIKQTARERLTGSRNSSIAVYLLALIAFGVLSAASLGLASLVLAPVIVVASDGFFAAVYRGEGRTVSDWFSGMFDGFVRKWLGMFLMSLKVFLWSLLLVIPGIVKAMAYSLTPYILAEYPGVSAGDAARLSDKMTYGYKMDIFVAGLSFLGWEMLSALTFGLLEVFFAGPYRSITFGGIYEELKRNAIERGTIREEELENGAEGTVY